MNEDFDIVHITDGNFVARLADGTVKRIGSSMSGMLRYTYFEDYTIPPKDWTVTNTKFREDYWAKIHRAVSEGKVYKDVEDGMLKIRECTKRKDLI